MFSVKRFVALPRLVLTSSRQNQTAKDLDRNEEPNSKSPKGLVELFEIIQKLPPSPFELQRDRYYHRGQNEEQNTITIEESPISPIGLLAIAPLSVALADDELKDELANSIGITTSDDREFFDNIFMSASDPSIQQAFSKNRAFSKALYYATNLANSDDCSHTICDGEHLLIKSSQDRAIAYCGNCLGKIISEGNNNSTENVKEFSEGCVGRIPDDVEDVVEQSGPFNSLNSKLIIIACVLIIGLTIIRTSNRVWGLNLIVICFKSFLNKH